MPKRVFLGCDKCLPELIAARLLADAPGGQLPDLSNIMLTLPGKLAREKVLKHLGILAPRGILTPQVLTPSLLMHYGMDDNGSVPVVADELIWMKTVSKALKRGREFNLIFPGKNSPEPAHAAAKLREFRNEVVRGGMSLTELAEFAGERGSQFAALENLYLQSLAEAGFTDPLILDRRAAEDVDKLLASGAKIILAGIPDLPNMLKTKLANIDRIAPEMIEIWIHAPESAANWYDQWGIPDAEVWLDKALLFPEENCIKALNPVHAAEISAKRAVKNGAFMPEKCAVVLSDPAMSSAFQREFSAFKTGDNLPLAVYDPSGVPMSRLRLCRLGHKLAAFLRHSNDFSYAAELLKEHDYLICFAPRERDILQALDEFYARFIPDELDKALELADTRTLNVPGYAALREALHRLVWLRQRFAELSVAEFLREFYRDVYAAAENIDEAELDEVPFASECQVMRKWLDTLEALPPELVKTGTKSQVLDIFFRHCGTESVAVKTGAYSYALEGCLEIPFLDAEQVIFCGMNEKYFPDRLELTPYLTDSIRRKAGLRCNRDTAVRARCHLHSLFACRPAGAVDVIVLRKDQENNALRPSQLLFAGSDLPDEVLLARCNELFRDPDLPEEKVTPGAKKIFRLAPKLDYKRDEASGMLQLSPTALDTYLTSPFVFFLTQMKNVNISDYALEEPDSAAAGTIYHQVFENLGLDTFPSVAEYERKLLDILEQVLNRCFGTVPHPVLVRLMAENMKQRMKFAAEILYNEQISGFQPVALEYKFENVELAGAVFSGRIDRIEYHAAENVFRVLDYKTGKVDDVAADHCTVSKGAVNFKKLQLPLYALLLRADPRFRTQFPAIETAQIECGYIHLPQSVTESCLRIWDREAFNTVLPAALEKTAEIIAEIKEFPQQILHEDPDAFLKLKKNYFKPFFAAGLRQSLCGISWQDDSTGTETGTALPAEAARNNRKEDDYSGMSPAVIPPPPQVDDTVRKCLCPPDICANCRCMNGNCADCNEFCGFKTFQIITAAAGTGKTYRLASRFIQLLAFNADPAEIMAVTFTKKAAGEIFDKIISRLLEFSTAFSRCRRMAQTDFIAIMRKLLNSDKELQISTIDSFFMQLVNAYAPELGIWGDINMVDQQDTRLLRRTFREWIRSVNDPEKLELLRELLKDANTSEDKNFAGSMLKLLHDVYPYYLLKVNRDAGGSMPQVDFLPWEPDAGDFISEAEIPDIAAALHSFADDLLDAGENCGNGTHKKSYDNYGRKLHALADFLPKMFSGFGRIDDEAGGFFKKLADYNDGHGWCERDGVLFFTKKLSFPEELSNLVRRVFRHLRAVLFQRVHRKTVAVFELMQEFDAVYSRQVRNAGNLTFTDLPCLLCNSDPDTYEAVLGPADRSLEARLDARIRHYMFDEFQDTSNIQWRAFDGLTRELFSSVPEDFRSFFCVGDIKQSIYQWRDGNPELFKYLLAQLVHPAAEQGYVPLDTLYLSHRSCQPVLDTVNRIFEPPYDGGMSSFEEVRQAMSFTAHAPAERKKDVPGFAALISYEKSGRDTIQIAAKARVILEILREIKPFSKDQSVAVLVQKNSTAEEFAEELRQLARSENLDLPVSAEGRISVAESMAFGVFRAMLTLAVHPGDRLAREFLNSVTFDFADADNPVKMDMKALAEKMGYDAVDFAAAVAEDIFKNGIDGVAERFSASFGAEMTPFDCKRMEYAYQAAAGFDGSVDEYLEKINHLNDSGSTLKQTVQVMTYHKSKGLDFDIVFIPDTSPSPGGHASLLPEAQVPESVAAYGEGMPEPEWISYLPPAMIAGEIPEFALHQEKKKYQQAYERCCGLYVALTRAARALYILVSPGSSSSSMALDQLLCERLAPYQMQMCDAEWFEKLQSRTGFGDKLSLLYSCGRESWHGLIAEVIKDNAQKESIPRQAVFAEKPAGIRRASEEKSHPVDPQRRFATAGGAAVGTLVHEMLEKLIRIDASWDMEKFLSGFADDSEFAAAAKNILRNALAEPSELTAMLRAVSPDAEVWCEKRFLLKTVAGEVVPGAFDRVVLHREHGAVVRAEIFDWKSDNLAAPEDFQIYAGQLRLYRQSLAQLLDIPESVIGTFICSLKLKKVIPV